jgi:hypothetical protein
MVKETSAMKTILFAAALSLSSIALAQATDPATNEPLKPGNDLVPPGDGITQQGTDPNGQATPPPGANEPMVAPPGAVVVPNPNQAAVFTPQAAQKEYPPCSKTVTDGCVQTYEKGARRRG